jgi:hypothetical protein
MTFLSLNPILILHFLVYVTGEYILRVPIPTGIGSIPSILSNLTLGLTSALETS